MSCVYILNCILKSNLTLCNGGHSVIKYVNCFFKRKRIIDYVGSQKFRLPYSFHVFEEMSFNDVTRKHTTKA